MTPRDVTSKMPGIEGLSHECAKLRAQGKIIVTTNGCFDLLHWGHLKYLIEARALGDILICAVNSDRSVRRLGKAANRPFTAERFRALQVAALEAVDYVLLFDEDTPEAILERIRPKIHVKGGDYRSKPLTERGVVEKYGGKIVIVDFEPGFSTTKLIEKIRQA